MTQETFSYSQHYKMLAAVRIEGKTYERTTTDRERDGQIDRQADISEICHNDLAHVLLWHGWGSFMLAPIN